VASRVERPGCATLGRQQLQRAVWPVRVVVTAVDAQHVVEVASAESRGPAVALLEGLDERLAGHHRRDAVRAHLLEMDGDREAIAHYRTAGCANDERWPDGTAC
jgi:hypothetical protein